MTVEEKRWNSGEKIRQLAKGRHVMSLKDLSHSVTRLHSIINGLSLNYIGLDTMTDGLSVF